MEDTIKNISDTAFWIAGFRAMETQRPDAVFKDPFAARLGGDRGLHMAAITPHSKAMAFAMTVRTTAIDRLISQAIDLGCDSVINMAAGLDTRPYRMDIPSSLKWIEIDLPALVAYKNEELKNEMPKCRLTRIAADLSESKTRNELFQQLGSEANKAVVVTEGLIAYLKPDKLQNFRSRFLMFHHSDIGSRIIAGERCNVTANRKTFQKWSGRLHFNLM